MKNHNLFYIQDTINCKKGN